jgi:hypothetical protein
MALPDIDFNTTTYAEGRALVKQAEPPAVAPAAPAPVQPAAAEAGKGIGQSIADWGKGLAGSASGALDSATGWLGERTGADPEYLRHLLMLIGLPALGGAGLGALTSLAQKKEERTPWRRALLGALLGGGIGGGIEAGRLSGLFGGKEEPKPDAKPGEGATNSRLPEWAQRAILNQDPETGQEVEGWDRLGILGNLAASPVSNWFNSRATWLEALTGLPAGAGAWALIQKPWQKLTVDQMINMDKPNAYSKGLGELTPYGKAHTNTSDFIIKNLTRERPRNWWRPWRRMTPEEYRTKVDKVLAKRGLEPGLESYLKKWDKPNVPSKNSWTMRGGQAVRNTPVPLGQSRQALGEMTKYQKMLETEFGEKIPHADKGSRARPWRMVAKPSALRTGLARGGSILTMLGLPLIAAAAQGRHPAWYYTPEQQTNIMTEQTRNK